MVLTTPPSASPGRHVGGRSASRSRCALVAGANAQIRQLLRTVLELGGFEVLEAASQGEVHARLSALPRMPHVVILDVGLPHFSGIATLALMRRQPRLCNVPVVVLAPPTDPPDHERFHLYGATAIVSKPFSAQRLLETVRDLAATTHT